MTSDYGQNRRAFEYLRKKHGMRCLRLLTTKTGDVLGHVPVRTEMRVRKCGDIFFGVGGEPTCVLFFFVLQCRGSTTGTAEAALLVVVNTTFERVASPAEPACFDILAI